MVGITFEERHHHFHADTRNGHRTETVTRPTGRNPDPATAAFAIEPGPVPVELNFDATMFIAINVFARRPGDAGGLADQCGSLRRQRWTIGNVPRDRRELIAVALGKTVVSRALAAGGLLK